MSAMDDRNKKEVKPYRGAKDYVPLNERLKDLKTRLDVPEYNEQQQILFPNNCEGLAKDVFKKVCRFITDCEVPSTDVCLVATNYKTTTPPPPRIIDSQPVTLLAELQTCCEPGRIACPELLMYSIDPEQSLEDMMLYSIEDIGLGDLRIGIDFKNRAHCCESEDSWEEGLESVDFIEILPSIKVDFSCDMPSLEVKKEYHESIELCYKRIELLRKYRIWMDLCKQDMSFEAIVEPVAEECLACDTSYAVSAETSVENACGNLTVKVKKNVTIDWCTPEFSEEFSIELSQECNEPQEYQSESEVEISCLHGAQLKCKLKEKIKVDWCSGDLSFEPELEAECSCEPISSPPSVFPINISIPGCVQSEERYSVNISGVGTVSNTLNPDGTIASNVSMGLGADGAFGPDGGIGFITNITRNGSQLYVETGYAQFVGGLFCGTSIGEPFTVDIDNIVEDMLTREFCRKLRRRCNLCECSDSSSSSSLWPCECIGSYTFEVPNDEIESDYEYSAPVAVNVLLRGGGYRIIKTKAVQTYKNSYYTTYAIKICGTEYEIDHVGRVAFPRSGFDGNLLLDVTLIDKQCNPPSDSKSYSYSRSSTSDSLSWNCLGEITFRVSDVTCIENPALIHIHVGDKVVDCIAVSSWDDPTLFVAILPTDTREELQMITGVDVPKNGEYIPATNVSVGAVYCKDGDESISQSEAEPSDSLSYSSWCTADVTFSVDPADLPYFRSSIIVFNDNWLDTTYGPTTAYYVESQGNKDVYKFRVTVADEQAVSRIRSVKYYTYSELTDSYVTKMVNATVVDHWCGKSIKE